MYNIGTHVNIFRKAECCIEPSDGGGKLKLTKCKFASYQRPKTMYSINNTISTCQTHRKDHAVKRLGNIEVIDDQWNKIRLKGLGEKIDEFIRYIVGYPPHALVVGGCGANPGRGSVEGSNRRQHFTFRSQRGSLNTPTF
ncbi:hypothetical protein ElyMa_006031700 [Elysia marginata]|uniref:Uncharacterized protein n=1 Tax=Elysia marginata TaxID=1093978 RepID=A0AAV4GIQ0_9GAST|nr:hypothetical protein ElyMa_006031700 [Elysia marginata]